MLMTTPLRRDATPRCRIGLVCLLVLGNGCSGEAQDVDPIDTSAGGGAAQPREVTDGGIAGATQDPTIPAAGGNSGQVPAEGDAGGAGELTQEPTTPSAGGDPNQAPPDGMGGAANPEPPVVPMTELSPLMVELDQVQFTDDFNTPGPLDPNVWTVMQNTRWAMEDGLLKGIAATPEFQASMSDHNGVRPVMDVKELGDFAVSMKIKFDGDSANNVSIDFDHHVLAVRFKEGEAGLYVQKATEPFKSRPFEFKLGTWYHVFAEERGEALVVQIAGGPTLYSEAKALAGPKGEFRVVGPTQGTVSMDDVTVWSVKPTAQPTWETARAQLL
ncbi:MAG: hypothetical protein RJA70_2940 [Pseudomonadota bacterium]|jgi:hypothetical protein